MAFKQRDFRKDKPKPLRVRIVCGFTPLDNVVSFISNWVENVFAPTTQPSGFPWG